MPKSGANLESLVQYIYQVMSDLQYPDIYVQRNASIVGKTNTKYEIDVYYDFVMNNHIHRVLIECKEWKNAVPKSVVLELSAKVNDIPKSIGIIVSTSGFQKGAIEYAENNGIDLISGGETFLLSKAIIARLGILLPNETVKNEPFWTIMEINNGVITGNYINSGQSAIADLFISKKVANEALLGYSKQGVVRGVDRHHLKILVGLAKLDNRGFNLFFFESNNCINIEPSVVEEFFY